MKKLIIILFSPVFAFFLISCKNDKAKNNFFLIPASSTDLSQAWVQDAYLKASNIDAGDAFGSSVAVSGNTVMVGANCESSSQTTITNNDWSASADNSASLSGAAYVFTIK